MESTRKTESHGLVGSEEAFQRFEEEVIERYERTRPQISAWRGFVRFAMIGLGLGSCAFFAYWLLRILWAWF